MQIAYYSFNSQEKTILTGCERSLLRPIFVLLVKQLPLVAKVIITATKEEVR